MDAFADHDDFEGHRTASLDAVALQRLLLETDTLRSFLDELAVAAAGATAHHCGVTVRGTKGGGDYTVASSDELALALDEQQYADGTGPCVEALHTGQPVFVTDLATESRWGPYPAHAVQMGARSSLSFPLFAHGDSIGALNLYSSEPAVPGIELQLRGTGLAGQIAGALALALRLADRDELIARLRVALTSRSTIDQAIGILMAQQRCDASAAFDLLRVASQSRNVKLREVAVLVVAGVRADSPRLASTRHGTDHRA